MKIRYRTFQDRAALWAFFSGYGLGWLAWWGRTGVLDQQIVNLLQFASMVFLLGAIGNLLQRRSRLLFAIPSLKVKLGIALLFFLTMSSVGLVGLTESRTGAPGLLGLLTMDVTAWAYMVAPLTLALLDPAEWRRFIFFILVGAAAMLAMTVQYLDVARALEHADRSGVYRDLSEQGLRHVASLHNGIAAEFIPLAAIGLLYARQSRISLILTLGAIAWTVFVALYYSKRQPVFELIMFIGFLLWLCKSSALPQRARRGLFSGLFLVGIGLLWQAFDPRAMAFLDRLLTRTSETYALGIDQFDRVVELTQFLDGLTWWEVLFTGRGFASYTIDAFSFGASVIHIGYGNLILKGGAPFLVFVTMALLYNLWIAVSSNKIPNRPLIFFLSSFVLIQLIYAPSWGFYPNLVLGLAMFAPEIARLHELRPVRMAERRRAKRVKLKARDHLARPSLP